MFSTVSNVLKRLKNKTPVIIHMSWVLGKVQYNTGWKSKKTLKKENYNIKSCDTERKYELRDKQALEK